VFPDEVEVDLDMPCTLVLNGVGGEVDGADVIVVDESALRQQSMELLEELSEPTSFSHVVGHGMILSLSARAGDDVLALGGPGVGSATRGPEVAETLACVSMGIETGLQSTMPARSRTLRPN
jgi:hypothetical protein